MRKHILVLSALFLAQFFTAQILVWNKNTPLTWKNFKATEKEKSWDSQHLLAASHCGISFTMTNSSDKNEPFQVKIQALFNEKKSWKKSGDLGPVVLKHEQGHFDIAEIYAREIRKMVKRKIKTRAQYHRNFKKNFDRIYKKYDNFQAQYDKGTSNHVVPKLQEKYDKKIERLLRKSEEYAMP